MSGDGRGLSIFEKYLTLWVIVCIGGGIAIGVYVALPLAAGYFSRIWIVRARGEEWFTNKFLHLLTPVAIIALLATLVLIFSFKGDVILSRPLTILWIAVPLFIQTCLIFFLTYASARSLRLSYEDAAPSAMIGASNHFEVAIATAVMLFGLYSGAVLATVVGVLIEVPVMLMLVSVCRRTCGLFAECGLHLPWCRGETCCSGEAPSGAVTS